MLKQMLEEQLAEYEAQAEANKKEFLLLMYAKKDEQAKEVAKKGAGIIMMRDHAKRELAKL